MTFITHKNGILEFNLPQSYQVRVVLTPTDKADLTCVSEYLRDMFLLGEVVGFSLKPYYNHISIYADIEFIGVNNIEEYITLVESDYLKVEFILAGHIIQE
jgi:hypothetical protein